MTLLGPLNFPLVQGEKGSKMELRSLDLPGCCRFSPNTQAGDSASMYRGDQQEWPHLVGPELSTTEARHWRDGHRNTSSVLWLETTSLEGPGEGPLYLFLMADELGVCWPASCYSRLETIWPCARYSREMRRTSDRTGWMNVRGTRRWSEQLCKTQSPEKAWWDLQDTESNIHHKESFLRALVVSLNVDSSCFW